MHVAIPLPSLTYPVETTWPTPTTEVSRQRQSFFLIGPRN
jgi:hypothetical protein